jgi:hypothetical protein
MKDDYKRGRLTEEEWDTIREILLRALDRYEAEQAKREAERAQEPSDE